MAGLGALLLDTNDDLYARPRALRAIIITLALHNVDDTPSGEDLKDGAGAIDAAAATSIAKLGYYEEQGYPYPACESPCWWHNPISWSTFPQGTWRNYFFKATRGERIRVALTWDSNPNMLYTNDQLSTNLD